MSTVSCSSRPGRNGPGLVQAAAFEFEPTAAGTDFVAAGFRAGAADGLCRLCRVVHWWGPGLRVVDGDFFDWDDHLLFGRRGCGGQLDYCEGGFQAGGGWGFGIGEEVVKGLDGEVGFRFHLFTEVEGATVLGVGEGLLEGEVIAAPVVDGVAMDAGLFRGGGGGYAVGQGVDDFELLRGESEFGHGIVFLVSG